MAEPHITATGAAVGLAAAPPLIVLGAQVDALVIGLAAAILVTFWMETIDSKLKSGAAMVFSALLAGYGSINRAARAARPARRRPVIQNWSTAATVRSIDRCLKSTTGF